MVNKAVYFLGIDGGGSKCKVRLESENGSLLSEAISGSANVATSYQQSQDSILHATELAFHKAGLAVSELKNTYVHAGLAGANIESAYQAMTKWQHPFAKFTLSTDMLIACKGAHQHHNGAVIILGTGFCAGYQQKSQFTELGGYGLLLSDSASGGWLGLQLCRKAFAVLDGVAKSSTAVDALLTQLNCHSSQALSQLLISASPAELAKFAPLVFSHSDDAFCQQLINEACAYITCYITYFEKQGIEQITLMGGIASAITPYLSDTSKTRLTPALASAEQGAILMARAAI